MRATGQVVLFDGYLAVYEEGRDDEEGEDSARLPIIRQGADAKVRNPKADQHFTEPPPRYSEASLVKKMEELGIGRPSTYASILTVLRDREYVRMDKNRFIPEDKGRLVTAFLEQFFRRYVEYDFTADLEAKLDEVSAGKLDWKALLRDFWKDFHAAIGEIGELRTTQVLDALNEALGPHIFPDKGDGSDPRACPTCGTGRLSVKTGKFGAFIGCSNYPECRFTRQIGAESADGDKAESGDRDLGKDPVTDQTVWLKNGRFGPYVQMGDGEKPKRSSLPKGWSPAVVDLEKALRLLRLPREVGAHPEDNQMILAGIGRYGPYVQHNGTYANLADPDDVFDVGLNRAVVILAERRAGAGKGGRTAPAALKDLGAHPQTGEAIRVLSGRYGPYVSSGGVNANVPKGSDPQSVTLEQAVALLAERAGKPSSKSSRPRRGSTASAASRSKPNTKAKPKAKPKAKARKAATAKL